MSIFVAHQGSENDGQLWYTAYDGQNFAGDRKVENFGMTASPSLVTFNGRLYYFHQGYGNDGQMWMTSTSDGEYWAEDTRVGTLGMTDSPSAVVYNGVLYHRTQRR